MFNNNPTTTPDLLEKIENAVIAGLVEATKRHDNLGPDGAIQVRENAFRETSLVCDIECELAIIEALKGAGLSGVVYTEEHGVIKIGDGKGLTITIDGLDGTSRYREAPGVNRYSTMIAVFWGDDPCYEDYLLTASKEHANKILYLAKKDQGAYVLTDDGQKKELKVSQVQSLEGVKESYLDAFFEVNKYCYQLVIDILSPKYLKASCIYYEDLAAGRAELVLECTRKGNLELACAYGLIREAGGTMLLLDETDLGLQRYKSFAQINKDGDLHIPIISACSHNLAVQVIDLCIKAT